MGERAIRAGRERTVEVLCEHFAHDELTVEELERRVDRAHRAETLEDLRDLLRDLPGGTGALEAAEGAGTGAVGSARGDVPPERVRERTAVLAVCGGNKRGGRWIPARHTVSLAVCGGVRLDFREASLGPGVTEVSVLAFCGGVEIIVPPDLPVEADGIALVGGFENVDHHPPEPQGGAPWLRVRGLALCGSVHVSVRRPGESRHEARRRRREARRRRRRLEKGRG